MNTGNICPLKELVELRKQYKLRFILDESLSIGVLGKNGRGLTEFLDVDVNLIFQFVFIQFTLQFFSF